MKLFVSLVFTLTYLSSATVIVNNPPSNGRQQTIDYDDFTINDNFSLLKPTDADEKETILKLSNFALNTLDKLDPDNGHRSLIDIVDSRKEFVNGILYHLTLSVAVTKKKETDSSSGADDDVDYIEKNICNIKILRTWAATSQSLDNAQVVGSQCGTPASTDNVVFKRAVKSKLVGGKTAADIDRDDVKRAANLAFRKLVQIASGDNVRTKRVNKIVKASTQVVAGTLYDITLEICDVIDDVRVVRKSCEICTITSVEQVWLNSFEIIKTDCKSLGDVKLPTKSTVKRSYEFTKNDVDVIRDTNRFLSFTRLYNKTYDSQIEMSRRFRIFRANLKKIRYLQETEQASGLYGVTEYADLNRAEFRKYLSGLRSDLRITNGIVDDAVIPDVELPDQFDWRDRNVVTPVKNQGLCGSCWAFSVTGNVEGQYAIKHKRLLSFSEQELVDCDKLDNGCGGGYMTNAYQAIEKLGGLETEQDYPYDGYGKTCRLTRNETIAEITSFVNISSNETKMAQWLLKNGPISIGINANAMQFYFGGISRPLKFLCNPKDIDHGVLIVGYGIGHGRFSKKPLPYWIVKNSWGPRWGVKGYYLVYRGAGVCGINTSASSALVA